MLPRSVLELDNLEAAKKMVERGLGVSLVPVSTIAAELAAGTLTRIELVDAAPVRREIVAVRRRRRPAGGGGRPVPGDAGRVAQVGLTERARSAEVGEVLDPRVSPATTTSLRPGAVSGVA